MKHIAEVTGYGTNWISQIVHRYDHDGPDGVGDRRHQNPEQPPLVPPEVRAKLEQISFIRNQAAHTANVDRKAFEELIQRSFGSARSGIGVLNGLLLAWRPVVIT
ncbi:MAG: hypothetical protein HC837_17620 [Chloroflexaceae bacterium]|nr:hypothetical protein [Chloroflexaceae bacterium]